MNKAYWVSVFLDGSVEDEKLKWLIDVSLRLKNKVYIFLYYTEKEAVFLQPLYYVLKSQLILVYPINPEKDF